MTDTIHFSVLVSFEDRDPADRKITAVSHRAAAETVISWYPVLARLVTVTGGGSSRRYSVSKRGTLRKLATYTYR